MNYIIDSQMTVDEVLTQNPDFLCQQEVLDKQRLLNVIYYSFDEKIHQGQVEFLKTSYSSLNLL